MKNLTSLPRGSAVFVDANVLIYFFVGETTQSNPVATFLERGANNEIRIFTSTLVVSDVLHRTMVVEAARQQGLELARTVTYLKKHPEIVKTLHLNLTIASRIHNEYGIDILPVGYLELHASRRFRTNYGLMTGDSVIVATMQRNKIVHLATNDRDFDRVKEIQVWSP